MVKFALIVGEDEIKNNLFLFKNLETKEDKKLSFEEVKNAIRL
jgi:histidyl-tRNA synthetase